MKTSLMFLFPGLLGLTVAADLPALPTRARAVLERALQDETGFVRIHAAEALLDTGHGEAVRPAFAGTGAGATATTARIGTWRVLALASRTDAERAEWIGRVRAVALDPAASDRLQALETLGKLHVRVAPEDLRAIRNFATQTTIAEAPMAWWVLHLNGAPDALAHLVESLSATDPVARLRAAYILKREHLTGEEIHAALTRAWSAEPADSIAYPYLLCALATLTTQRELQQDYIDRLSRLLATPTTSGRYEMSLTLMQVWPAKNAARLEAILDAPDADTRVGAAWAILHLTIQTGSQNH